MVRDVSITDSGGRTWIHESCWILEDNHRILNTTWTHGFGNISSSRDCDVIDSGKSNSLKSSKL